MTHPAPTEHPLLGMPRRDAVTTLVLSSATTILFELKDPRVKNVTVTRAEVSADLQHAKVYVSVMGSEKEQQLTMHGLRSAAGFVQKPFRPVQLLAAVNGILGSTEPAANFWRA